GVKGVEIEDPDSIKRDIDKPDSLDYFDDEFVNSIGDEVIVKAYFHDGSEGIIKKEIKERIENIKKFLDVGKALIVINEIDDKDWENEWKKYYKRFDITQKIIIQPTWDQEKINENKIVIKLDPGMAFGTGTHETTKMCANLLEKYLKKSDSVLDVGCGSGILSIIATKLGALRVNAFDIDSVAVKVANQNFIQNSVEKKILLKCCILEDISIFKYNIVVANVISDTIIDLGQNFKTYLKDEGLVIVSGIIKDRKKNVIDVYNSLGYDYITSTESGEWVAIVFKWQDFS
ncbi:MAG: 50S ribosomal protein L11 methyltransferase, partial [Clostridiales bacterium]